MFRATALNGLRHPFPNAPRFSPVTPHSFGRTPRLSTPRNFSSSRPTRAIHYVRFGGNPSNTQPRKRLWKINRAQWLIGLGVIGVVYYVSHLEQVPETGRWRFMNISRKFEDQIGKLMRDQLFQEYAHQILPPDHVTSQHVRGVVSQILSASNLGRIHSSSLGSTPDFVAPFGGQAWDPDGHEAPRGLDSQNTSETQSQREWEVVVIDDPNVINALAQPGLIVVFTGILPLCRDDRGLSAVLAHEIGHVVARHAAETISSQSIGLALLTLLQYMDFDFPKFTGLAHHLLIELPNSRTMEYEADKIGLTLMSRACYDPRGAVEMFGRLDRLESATSTSGVDFFHTHPSGAKRVQELLKLLPEAYGVFNANSDCAAIQDRLVEFRRVSERGW